MVSPLCHYKHSPYKHTYLKPSYSGHTHFKITTKLGVDLTIIFSKRSSTSFSDKLKDRSSYNGWGAGNSLIATWESVGCWIKCFSFLTVDFLKLVIRSRCKEEKKKNKQISPKKEIKNHKHGELKNQNDT